MIHGCCHGVITTLITVHSDTQCVACCLNDSQLVSWSHRRHHFESIGAGYSGALLLSQRVWSGQAGDIFLFPQTVIGFFEAINCTWLHQSSASSRTLQDLTWPINRQGTNWFSLCRRDILEDPGRYTSRHLVDIYPWFSRDLRMIPGIMLYTHDTRDLRMILFKLVYAGFTHDALDLRVIYVWCLV